MSGVFKTSSPADNNNKKQQHKLQEIQSRIRVQQSQQQQNNRIPSPPFYSSAPSFSNNNCIQKQRIEFNHVDNIQNIVKTSEDKNSSNNKNWAAKTSLLNRLRLKSASFEGRKCNNGGNDKEKVEINGTKEQTEINKNNCILLADEAFTKASSSISISNPVGAISTTNQNNFNHSLSALNSTSTSGALNKQRSPSPPPSLFANTDNCIKQEFDPELSASLFEQSRTLCDNKNTSNSLTNTLTEPSQSINTETPHFSSFPNSFVDSEVNTPNTLIEKRDDKLEQQNLPSPPSTSAASQQQQKSPSLEPFAVPALPTPKQKAVPLSFNRQEEPKLLKKEQEEIQTEQETNCLSAASTSSLKTEQTNVSQVPCTSINNEKQNLKQQLPPTYFQSTSFDETEATSSSKLESFEVFLDKEKGKSTGTSEVLAKSKRLSLRVSSAAASQFNRLALHHSKALNILGINSIQLKSSLNCLSPVIQIVDKRASFDYLSQRRARLHQLRSQKQTLIQLIQKEQLEAVAALHQRNSQRHQVTYLPGKTATPNVAGASMSSVAQTSKKRLVPVSAESSPHLNSQHHVQRQHNSSSSSSNSTTPQQRTPPSHPYCPVQPSFSSPSSTSILQQQNEHQQHSNKNKNNDGSYLMHSAPIPQQQHSTINAQNQTLASAGAAENSPLLVNLLNNNASSPAIQQTQKPQQILQQNVTPLPQQQQMMMIKQQQQMAALQQQHPNAMGQAQQVNSHQYGVPMNPQQHQQMYQQQQQRLAQQQSMMYSVGPSGVINNTPQQHYMIVGSPPTGSSPSQYHRQTTHYGANGQPVPGGIVASPPGAPSPYFGMPPNYVPQQMIIPTTGADKQGSSGQMFSIGPPINNTQLAVEELPKKRKRISKKQQQKEEREREQRLRLQEQQQQAAMAAFRQHQQMAFMQQQQQQQRMAAVNAGIPQQMCGGMVMPSNMQNCQVPPGQVIAAQQHYQQQQQTYQQHYLGLPGQPAIQKQDTNVIQNNMSPSICPYGTPQKGSPMQPTGAPMSQQQQYVVALQQQQHGQQTLQNQCYVSPQQQAPWANTPNQMSHQCGMQQQQQNALNDYQSTAAITNQSQQQQSATIDSVTASLSNSRNSTLLFSITC
uniref:Uncharacterized protein n=1 Tax=Meloidogyne enterolobii TaxID=390850 RepID=A0A6V7XT05_MELEN|nr:unnamed protein product [Meloidogyne enterolobii]